jgi:uncharacterized protein YjbJ (UPF0337 family)
MRPWAQNDRRNIMDKARFKSRWQQFKAEFRNKWPQVTDDDFRDVEGDYDRFCSVVQKRCSDCEEAVMGYTNDWYSKDEQQEILARKATESRNQA